MGRIYTWLLVRRVRTDNYCPYYEQLYETIHTRNVLFFRSLALKLSLNTWHTSAERISFWESPMTRSWWANAGLKLGATQLGETEMRCKELYGINEAWDLYVHLIWVSSRQQPPDTFVKCICVIECKGISLSDS